MRSRTVRTTRSALVIRPGAPCRVSRSKHSRPRVPSISPNSSFEEVALLIIPGGFQYVPAIPPRSFAAQRRDICPHIFEGSRSTQTGNQPSILQRLAGSTNTQATRLHQYATCALIQRLSAIASLSVPSLLADDAKRALTVMHCLLSLLVHVHPGDVPEGVVERARVVVHEV